MKDLPCWEFVRISTNIRDGAAQTPNKLFCCEITDKVKAETQQRSNIHSRDSALISRAHRLHLEFPDPVCPSPGQINGSPLLWGVCQSCWIPSLPLLAAPEPVLQLILNGDAHPGGWRQHPRWDCSSAAASLPPLPGPGGLLLLPCPCCPAPGGLGAPRGSAGTSLGIHLWWELSAQPRGRKDLRWGPEQLLLSLFWLLQRSCPNVFGVWQYNHGEKNQKLQLKTKIKAMLRTALLLWLGWKGRGSIVFFSCAVVSKATFQGGTSFSSNGVTPSNDTTWNLPPFPLLCLLLFLP